MQDDYANKQAELNKMGEIYRNSVFAIIAAEGDHANRGFPGVPGDSRDRKVTYDYLECLSRKPIYSLPLQVAHYSGMTWN